MIKRVRGKKLSRSYTARKALLRSLVFSLVKGNKIETTLGKAKLTDAFFLRLINDVKKDNLGSFRKVLALMANDQETTKQIVALAKNWDQKTSPIKLTRISNRKGDNALMARLEIVVKAAIETVKENKEKKKVVQSKKEK